MHKRLEDYISINNILNPKICDDTVSELEAHEFQKHTWTDKRYSDGGSRRNDFDTSNRPVRETNHLYECITSTLRQYVSNLDFPWFQGGQGVSSIKFNKYKEGTNIATHCDHIHSIFEGEKRGVPVLSLIGILNDDYEGGELILLEDMKVETKKGDIVIFPSNFMYPHQVTTITKGTRYSFVSWAW